MELHGGKRLSQTLEAPLVDGDERHRIDEGEENKSFWGGERQMKSSGRELKGIQHMGSGKEG